MSYIRSLIPTSESIYLGTQDTLKIWQEKILHSMLLVGSVFGIVLTVYSLAPAVANQEWMLFIGSSILGLISTILFLLRRISYWFRSITALVVIYIFANIIFFRNGWGGLSLFLLLGFSFLCTILLFKKPTRTGIAISILTFLSWIVFRFANSVPVIGAINSSYYLLIDIILTFLVGIAGNLAIDTLRTLYLEECQKTESTRMQVVNVQEQLNRQKENLEKRLYQLKTASEISQKISTIFDSQTLITEIAELIQDRFSLYYVGIFLLDNVKEFAVLRYGTGDPGRQMVGAKHKLSVGGFSMIGWATQNKKPRIALDVGSESVRFDNPLLPETRSELAMPIISGNNVFGAMTIQSSKSNAFDEDDITVLQGIADNLAIALENADSFEKTQKAIEDIRLLNKTYVQESWLDALDKNRKLEFIYENKNVPVSNKKTKSVQIPLTLRDEIIGNINLEIEGNEIPHDQIEFLETISTQTSIALENARLLEESQLAAIQEQKINELTSQFSKSLTVEEILKTAVLEFSKLPLVDEASISLIPPEEISTTVVKPTTERENNE